MKSLFSILIMGTLVAALAIFTFAGVPHMINYQGKLTDASGNLIPGTVTKSMIFTIYDDSTGGNILWIDTIDVELTHGVFSVLLGEAKPIPDSVFNGEVRYLGVKVGTDPEMSPRKKIVSVGYAYRSEWADTARVCIIQADNDWNYWSNPPNMSSIPTGNVGIGTASPAYKLDVAGDIRSTGQIRSTVATGTAPLAVSSTTMNTNLNADMVDGKHGTNLVRGVGTTNYIPKWVGSDTLSNSVIYQTTGGNVGIGTTSPAYKLDVNGTARVTGTIVLHYDWEVTTHIDPGSFVTLTHGQGGNPQKYIVYMVGISSEGHYVHQKNYGTSYRPLGYLGCEWGRLTSSTVTIWRGSIDNTAAPYDDWDSTRICILKNQ
jgi:hypothetical protein